MRLRHRDMLDAVHYAADAQMGLITAAQLSVIGIPNSTLAKRIRTGGRWRRILPGIYYAGSSDLGIEQREQAGLLFAGNWAVLTGVSALRRHGVRYLPGYAADRPVHTAIPVTRHRKSAGFVVVERTQRPPRSSAIEGLDCATAARAVVDAGCRITDRRETRAMVLETVQTGLVSIPELQDELRQAQRRGSALLGDCIAEARAGVRSAPEAELRQILLQAPIPEPVWNPQMYLPGGKFLGQPDGLIVESMVALEVDSQTHHAHGDDWMDTLDRGSDFIANGLLVVHIVPTRLRADPMSTVRRVVAAHRQGLTRPRPDIEVVTPHARTA